MAYNPYLVVPLATWAVAQVLKFAIAAAKGRVDLRYLYASGGMPSVHSAVVCALATTALLVGGVESSIFGLSVVFGAIVMYDSFGVRRSSGEQAAAINMLIDSLDRNRVKLDQPDLQMREILGHQPREVTLGALLGVLLGLFFNYDKLGKFGQFFQIVPKKNELIVYAAIFAVLIVGGLIARFALRARYPKSKTMKTLATRVLVATQTIGWVGLASCLLVYERASYFAWRLWPLLVLATGLVWGILLATSSYKEVPAKLALEKNEARKLKWLNWGKGRKSKRA